VVGKSPRSLGFLVSQQFRMDSRTTYSAMLSMGFAVKGGKLSDCWDALI
jgi:hypothetical protein